MPDPDTLDIEDDAFVLRERVRNREARIESLEAINAEVEAALVRYAAHDEDCSGGCDPDLCRCGLDEILRRIIGDEVDRSDAARYERRVKPE